MIKLLISFGITCLVMVGITIAFGALAILTVVVMQYAPLIIGIVPFILLFCCIWHVVHEEVKS